MKTLRSIRIFAGLLVGFASAALLARRWNRRFMLKTVCPEQIQDEPGKSRSGKRVVVAVLLDCQLESAWQQVLTGGLLEYLAWPWITFKSQAGSGLPDVWSQGDRLQVDLYLLNFFPLGTHSIFIEQVDERTRFLQTREHGDLAQTWDHAIQLQEVSEHQVLYSDEIALYAGRWTSMLAWLVNGFFQHRQVRFQTLARRL